MKAIIDAISKIKKVAMAEIRSSTVKDFFGAEFIKKSEAVMARAIQNKRFTHPIEVQCLAAIIAGGLL